LKKLKVLVVDGQGGGIGRQIIENIVKADLDCIITAVGTNAAATAAMLKAGAHQGATGENAVVVCAREAHAIVGPVGIAIADSLLGEITPVMAAAIGGSSAKKLLLPVNHCNNIIVGVQDLNLKILSAEAVEHLKRLTAESDM